MQGGWASANHWKLSLVCCMHSASRRILINLLSSSRVAHWRRWHIEFMSSPQLESSSSPATLAAALAADSASAAASHSSCVDATVEHLLGALSLDEAAPAVDADLRRELPAALTSAPRHLLILDLNGMLLDRRRTPFPGTDPDLTYSSGKLTYYVHLRPHAREFVAFALAHFRVAVWSSAMLHNIKPMLQLVFLGPNQVQPRWVCRRRGRQA